MTLRGTPTGTRSDISVTSFAMAHIITCAGNGGMVLLDRRRTARPGAHVAPLGAAVRAPPFRDQGRRPGLPRGPRRHPYDNDYIFDVLPWNFEPSELGAAYGLRQLDKLTEFQEVRQRQFAGYQQYFEAHEGTFIPARQTEGLETAWLCYPVLVRPEAPFGRADLQEYLEGRGIDTRTIWTGNITRQPMMKGVEFRLPASGLPNADRVRWNRGCCCLVGTVQLTPSASSSPTRSPVFSRGASHGTAQRRALGAGQLRGRPRMQQLRYAAGQGRLGRGGTRRPGGGLHHV